MRPFDLALRTHPGTHRTENQDACGHLHEAPDRVLFVVADGVGGYDGGQEAARLAVEVTIESFRNSPKTWSSSKRLAQAVQEANVAIHDRAMIVTELRHMRSTITASVADGRDLHVAHVGDCRLYLSRGGALVQLTKDHTVVASRVRMGLLRPDRVADHAARGMLTRCLGSDLIVAIDRISRTLEGGDLLLVCSDGLYNTLDDQRLLGLAEHGSAAEVCRALIDTANVMGTADNVTAAVLRVSPTLAKPESPTFSQRVARFFGR